MSVYLLRAKKHLIKHSASDYRDTNCFMPRTTRYTYTITREFAYLFLQDLKIFYHTFKHNIQSFVVLSGHPYQCDTFPKQAVRCTKFLYLLVN